MAGALIYIILIGIVIMRFAGQNKTKGGGHGSSTGNRTPAPGRGPLAADGHRIPKDQDISCRRYGHKHEEFDTPRYIPHNDPEDGYIVLNGVKMKLSEADRYEDRI